MAWNYEAMKWINILNFIMIVIYAVVYSIGFIFGPNPQNPVIYAIAVVGWFLVMALPIYAIALVVLFYNNLRLIRKRENRRNWILIVGLPASFIPFSLISIGMIDLIVHFKERPWF